MGVSNGFNRKINEWILSKEGRVAFRPFLVNGNPYKSRIFVSGSFPHPVIEVDEEEREEYIESLVDTELWDTFYGEQMGTRENKGTTAFIQWLKEACGETAVHVNLTALMADSAKKLKEYSKESPEDYEKGFRIFQEAVEEFQPEFLILYGSDAVKQFRKRFGAAILDRYPQLEKVQDLEEYGVFADWSLSNGRKVQVIACRNLSYYGKMGEAFGTFKERVKEALV
ncbi:hypothetical protein [Lysinibacillus sp. 3P01SB]|uniref:hypothetical protein n=1 Tax=Lysinibacillus sp. 3P01SB TaxID=3132284 RepID=UPI0039A62D1B